MGKNALSIQVAFPFFDKTHYTKSLFEIVVLSMDLLFCLWKIAATVDQRSILQLQKLSRRAICCSMFRYMIEHLQ